MIDSSDESAAEVDDAGRDEEDESDLPLLRESTRQEAARYRDDNDGQDVPVPSSAKNPRSSQSMSARLQKTAIISDEDEDEDEDDDDIVPPSSTLKRRRLTSAKPSHRDESEDEEDEEDEIAPPSTLRRRRPAMIELEDDSDSEGLASPTKKRTNKPALPSQNTRRRLQASSSSTKRSAHKGHRSKKEKMMELLRRRRAGEKIDKLTSSESSEDDRRGMYDTDSEAEFKMLKEFDDDVPGAGGRTAIPFIPKIQEGPQAKATKVSGCRRRGAWRQRP